MAHPGRPSSYNYLQSYRYQVCTGTGASKTISDAYDLLAVRISLHDAWYLIPKKAIGTRASVHVYPHNPKSNAKYEKYRDGFGLL